MAKVAAFCIGVVPSFGLPKTTTVLGFRSRPRLLGGGGMVYFRENDPAICNLCLYGAFEPLNCFRSGIVAGFRNDARFRGGPEVCNKET
jgi:hypothetical protein